MVSEYHNLGFETYYLLSKLLVQIPVASLTMVL